MIFLSLQEIIHLHKKSLIRFGGLYGIRDKTLLESATEYPKMLHDIGKEQDIFLIAASYCFHLIKNHAFIDGNKRIGIFAMITFLDLNNLNCNITNRQLINIGLKTAQSQMNESQIAKILRKSCVIKHDA